MGIASAISKGGRKGGKPFFGFPPFPSDRHFHRAPGLCAVAVRKQQITEGRRVLMQSPVAVPRTGDLGSLLPVPGRSFPANHGLAIKTSGRISTDKCATVC